MYYAQPFTEALIALPYPKASADIQMMLARRRTRGRWDDQWSRTQFRIFYLLDGHKSHVRVGEILHMKSEEVRQALILLMLDHHIVLKKGSILGREMTLNGQMLAESFSFIEPNGLSFAQDFYHKLFARSEEIKRLFASTNMQKQCQALISALRVVVAGAAANHDITAALSHLGAKHRSYGVRDEYYPIVGECLLESLQEYFSRHGIAWTEELAATWTDAYGIITDVMKASPTR